MTFAVIMNMVKVLYRVDMAINCMLVIKSCKLPYLRMKIIIKILNLINIKIKNIMKL